MDQARRDPQPAAQRFSRPRRDTARRRRAAAGLCRATGGKAARLLQHPGLRRHAHAGVGLAAQCAGAGLAARRGPAADAPRVPRRRCAARPLLLRQLRQQWPVRRRARARAHPGDRAPFSRHSRAGRALRRRSLVRRLGVALAAGRLPRFLRRLLEHVARPGGLPRVSGVRPLLRSERLFLSRPHAAPARTARAEPS